MEQRASRLGALQQRGKMKRFFVSLCLLCAALCAAAAAEDDDGGDEYDDGSAEEYRMNGPGDKYIQISLMPSFPLNFDGKMYVGGAAQIGYHQFLLSWLSVGGDLMVGYSPTLGSNIFNYWPVTATVTFQPTVWRFEFPITIGVGLAFETYRNRKYFPGFVLKPEFSIYYRINESWSVGIGTIFLWLPQWFKGDDSVHNFDGLFITADASVRYHF